MDSIQIISWLSRSVYDSSILESLVSLKKILNEITEEDKNELFGKYPKLKKVFENLTDKLSI